MPSITMTKPREKPSALPPLPAGHGFAEGDRVEQPVWGYAGLVRGTVVYLDVIFCNKHYKGLAVLSDNGRYYELDPALTRKIDSE